MLELAGPLTAVVRRHLALRPQVQAGPPTGQRLGQRWPALTERELQVCERLLRGLTFEGIGADLGLSAATVKTYRNRAFGRLGIHHRNQLFSLVLGAPQAGAAPPEPTTRSQLLSLNTS